MPWDLGFLGLGLLIAMSLGFGVIALADRFRVVVFPVITGSSGRERIYDGYLDEVTSALGVLLQAAFVQLLAGLQRDLGQAMLFVTHNLPLVQSIADRVMARRSGRLVEEGPLDVILTHPQAEYTRRLLHGTPKIETV